MNNPTHILETALLLLAAYLLGCLLGYAARRVLHAARGTRQPTTMVSPSAVPEPIAPPLKRVPTPAARLAASAADEPAPLPAIAKTKPAVATLLPKPKSAPTSKPASKPKRQPAEPKPASLSAPRDGRADNLKQIKGIGPKIEASLNGLGIYHFDQIAGWTRANIEWVDGQLAFKGRIRREQWVEQATELTKAKISA